MASMQCIILESLTCYSYSNFLFVHHSISLRLLPNGAWCPRVGGPPEILFPWYTKAKNM